MKAILLRITPGWLLGLYHLSLAFLGAFAYGFPSRKLRVIGVTGTKGKTTVVELIHRMLEQAGTPTASLSSLRFKVKDEEEQNELKMTMPGRFMLQRFLAQAVRAGCRYAVLEVTSQGIAQHRHRFIRFAVAVMTNIAPEHLEAHGGFEEYLRAKLKLFQAVKRGGVVVINRDDPNAERFAVVSNAEPIWYGRHGITTGDKEFRLEDVILRDDGLTFVLGGVQFSSKLIGEFNLYNILAAVAVGLAEGIGLKTIAEAIADTPGVPGRMEYVQREPFAVIVDYAHTPDSLKIVYQFLRSKFQAPSSKLVCVLGSAGGGRDKWKRPEMGKIAAQYCDEIILTDEDPYDEDPSQILSEIKSGISNVLEILDRRKAIAAAIKLARPGDTVVITGKGAEPWLMGPKGTKIPWDDRAVVRETMRNP